MSEPFIAEIRAVPYQFAPRGWAFCDGQLVPISQNTALFSLIGTTYGGDGRTTTALPNLQGRFPMHPGRGPGLTLRRLGEKGGSDSVTLTESQIPSHNHGLIAVANDANSVDPSNRAYAVSATRVYQAPGTVVDMAANSISNSGGGQSHNNLQPYLVLNFIIALQGLYPSRS